MLWKNYAEKNFNTLLNNLPTVSLRNEVLHEIWRYEPGSCIDMQGMIPESYKTLLHEYKRFKGIIGEEPKQKRPTLKKIQGIAK